MIRIEERRQRVVQLVMELTGDPDSDVTVTTVLEAFAADGPVAVLPGGEVVGMRELVCADVTNEDNTSICLGCETPSGQFYRLVADEEDGDG